ncbi:ribbon-helix-helix domain-containing protein [Gulbenkiania mobilis]|uniref:ribbon-helix-helix domain-containing protein n=1 Tax=Gulbenkiania mobilis TaxID=397457 RepID=UPI0006BBC672|nr:ribbon-helix-helix domain-containing protein [Gulbenkiania mobilis]
MTITKPKPKPVEVPQAVDAFISGAPDAPKSTGRGIRKGRKEQITIALAPALLDRLDARAAALGQSRSALIGLAIAQALESGFGGIGGAQD